MSRWNNKARVQSFAIPLDSLVNKEKENTNRPVAARSAGTVGKWGTTSFTSIRTPSYGKKFDKNNEFLIKNKLHHTGYTSYSPQQDALLNPNISPQSGDGNLTPNSPRILPQPSPDVPKPKKFFKSRNVVPTDVVFAAAAMAALPPPSANFYQQQQQQPVATTQHMYAAAATVVPKLSLKINKKLLKADATTVKKVKKVKEEKAKKVKEEKVKKVKEEKVKVEKPKKVVREKVRVVKAAAVPAEPTRVLSRQRKAVNYSENRSRSPSPRRPASSLLADEVEDEGGGGVDDDVAEDVPMEPPAVADIAAGEQMETDADSVVGAEIKDELPVPLAERSPPAATEVAMTVATPMLSPSECQSVNQQHPPIVLRISKVNFII